MMVCLELRYVMILKQIIKNVKSIFFTIEKRFMDNYCRPTSVIYKFLYKLLPAIVHNTIG